MDDTPKHVSRSGARLIRHPVNLGKGEALKTGFRAVLKAGLDGVITLDGDGQHDPGCIPNFLRALSITNSDIILGTRSLRLGAMPLDRIFSNRMSSLLVSALSGKWIPDSQCGYRLIRTVVFKNLTLQTGHYETETELLVKAVRRGCRIGFCPIPVRQVQGSSHIRRFQDTVRFLWLLYRLLMKKNHSFFNT